MQNSNTFINVTPVTIPPKVSVRKVAEILGVSPLTVRRRLPIYGISKCRDGMIRAGDARKLLEE